MIRRVLGLLLVWVALAAVTGIAVFVTSSTRTTVAGHDAEVRPTLDGWVTLRTGALLPDLRIRADHRLGVELILGKTQVDSVEALVDRYALLAADPDAQVDRVRSAVRGLAWDAMLRGGLAASAAVAFWALVGRSRRRELAELGGGHHRWVAAGVVGALAAGVVAWQPWRHPDPLFITAGDWQPLGEYVGPEVTLPKELADAEITSSSVTDATRRLLLSALDSYQHAQTFYDDAAEAAADLLVRQPEDGETVALLISDRHDNIGMDRVVRAIGDAAGATAVLDAGDDTSTGQTWETFSLDSLAATFDDLDRWVAVGNHDNGGYVRDYLGDHGWQVATGKVVEGPGDSTLLALDDPRSSGLGRWRDPVSGTVAQSADAVAKIACASDERVGTLLVHDANAGTEALRRGCVDLVLSGHVHVASGPSPVVGVDGAIGWTHTTGTAGGAAYAIAVGSKLRRAAAVSLVTYADGRPVGVQVVTLETTGQFRVGDYQRLGYDTVRTASDPP
jgi:hypothetical protein